MQTLSPLQQANQKHDHRTNEVARARPPSTSSSAPASPARKPCDWQRSTSPQSSPERPNAMQTTAVITFIDANGNKASVFTSSFGFPSGGSGVLMQLRDAVTASCHTYDNLAQFDAGNLAACFIVANFDSTRPCQFYVCRKPKEVDARFRYTVRANADCPYPLVQCRERDEEGMLFVVPFDANMGLRK